MARAPYPSEAAEKLLIRFPAGMREKIAESAAAAGRSMNAEVVARLEKSFDDDSAGQALADMVEDHDRQISDIHRLIEDLQASVSALYRG